MSEKIRFHLDENVSTAIARSLRKRGIDVTTTPELNLIQATDEDQLDFARKQGRVLVTHDSDFLRLHDQGFPHCGIVFCRLGSKSIGQMIKSLILIYEILEPAEMMNCIEFL
ncbi:MAG: DUF5615 family PIN-like protein [candidate division KSB1 bacterium]|nr:DUF5615 family PIN-like protein [candidate division KSB1 bacterium]MDZ7401460.1 DUF5615 family PIN-like protein [candidate division KSB1 bacterium]